MPVLCQNWALMKIRSGESVVLVLRDPRERLLGILGEIDMAGVHLRAIDLSYFDDWVRSIIAGEQYLPMNDYFIPMWRVERLMRDEGTQDAQSMAEQFQQKTGRKLGEF